MFDVGCSMFFCDLVPAAQGWEISGSGLFPRRFFGRQVLVQSRLDDLLIALGANAVAESGVGVLGNIFVELLPIIVVVTDFFAVEANGQQSLEYLDGRQRRFESLQ